MTENIRENVAVLLDAGFDRRKSLQLGNTLILIFSVANCLLLTYIALKI